MSARLPSRKRLDDLWLQFREFLAIPMFWTIIGLCKLVVWIYPEGSQFEVTRNGGKGS